MHNVKREQSKITAKKVMEMISAQCGISVSDMTSKKRQKKVVETRQIAMYLLKNNDDLDLSLTAIGGLFGGKDHAQFQYAAWKIGVRPILRLCAGKNRSRARAAQSRRFRPSCPHHPVQMGLLGHKGAHDRS